jgi:peptidoglycan/xylan/chitin deacetylase (PgdA/CDA1 family)
MENPKEDSRVLRLLKDYGVYAILFFLGMGASQIAQYSAINKQSEATQSLKNSIDSVRVEVVQLKRYVDTMKVIHPYKLSPKK